MKVREGKTKVPILPRKAQIAFASVTGVAFVALLVFVLVRPTVAESSIAQVDTVQKTIASTSIDGPAEELSTVEKKKPLTIAPEVAGGVTVDGEADAVNEKKTEDAQPTKKEASEKETVKSQEKAVTVAPKQYIFVARVGDSYTAMVRSAITLYIKSQGISLSPAQRVAAETFLTQKAGAPLLSQAQRVTISADDVKAAVDQAQSLTNDELAVWDVFADQVDWDNDDTPEPAADDGGASSAIDGGGVGSASAGGSGAGGASGGGGN
ncbi:hypothetical protein KI440_02715 [Candidatus Saccharibacteria bacterium TM7i]|nr:hypothetical protein KI440_02715 [Candidatus Saccharibacteria bacterium TM7i]